MNETTFTILNKDGDDLYHIDTLGKAIDYCRNHTEGIQFCIRRERPGHPPTIMAPPA